MARQGIFTGFSPNDGTGDSLASGAVKINSNFQEIYNTFGDGNNLLSYVNTAGIATYAVRTGVATYATSAGFATNSTNATSASNASTATYAVAAGISTVAQGLTGTPNLNVGVVTAISFSGSGVNLTGIITTLVAGSNVTITQSLGIATISASGTGSGGSGDYAVIAGYSTSSGIATVAQGLTGTPNITVGQVGISSYLSVTGVSSFYNNVHLEYDRYLLIGNDNELQLFHNGANSYIDNSSTNNLIIRTHGGSIQLDKEGPELMGVFNTDGSVELYYDSVKKFETTGYGATIFGGLNVSGVVTATSFVGDGSGLTGVVGSSSGVVIKDDGSLVGTASTIDFGSNLSVSFASGIATVSASSGGGSSQWVTTAAGIHTLSNVGIGTTNPTSTFSVDGTVDVTGISTFHSDLRVSNSDSNLRLGLESDQFSSQLKLRHNGGSSYIYHTGSGTFHFSMEQGIGDKIQFDTVSEVFCRMYRDGPVELYYDNSKKFETTNSGAIVTGIVTATAFVGDGSGLTNLPGPLTGIGTFSAVVGLSTVIDSFNIATENISIIEYNIFINNGGNRIQSQKTLIMLGDEAYSQEYAVMYTTNHLVSVGATISGGICNVTVTPSSGVSGLTTFKFSKGGSV